MTKQSRLRLNNGIASVATLPRNDGGFRNDVELNEIASAFQASQ